MDTIAERRYRAKLEAEQKKAMKKKALMNLHASKNKMTRDPMERSMPKEFSRMEKSGNSFETAIHIPMIPGGGGFDWDSPKENSFVIVPINNKKSSLHGRFVVLEKLPNGMYRIAKKQHRNHLSREEQEKMEAKKRKIADTDLDKERIEKANKGAAYSRTYMSNSPGGGRASGLSPSSVRKMRRMKSFASNGQSALERRLQKALEKWS
jgi:hypothetical protein